MWWFSSRWWAVGVGISDFGVCGWFSGRWWVGVRFLLILWVVCVFWGFGFADFGGCVCFVLGVVFWFAVILLDLIFDVGVVV